MTVYLGPSFSQGNVSLCAVNVAEVSALGAASDVADAKAFWLAEAESRDDVLYFAVRTNGELVGQFFLHDIDELHGAALLGYHLFEPRFRARGIGSTGLKLLQRYERRPSDVSSRLPTLQIRRHGGWGPVAGLLRWAHQGRIQSTA